MKLPVGDGVAGAVISPDCQLIAAGCEDNSVHVRNMQGNVIDCLGGANGHNGAVYGIAFHPNSKQIISGSLDGTIKIWELDLSKPRRAFNGGRCLQTLQGHRVSPHPPEVRNRSEIKHFAGFRYLRRHDSGCSLGTVRFQGLRRAVLGPGDW